MKGKYWIEFIDFGKENWKKIGNLVVFVGQTREVCGFFGGTLLLDNFYLLCTEGEI